MGWIAQEYEGEVHVVPDTEFGHVLSPECPCAPILDDNGVLMHNDELDRCVKEPTEWR